ncbi:hypothetical protein MKW98_008029 [Papaver atlanticum]|uniref:Uncharacterized protein n=1 Tax=Papaver atlanticum TaxID=357466 RepID=A0AAD4SY49_9MAGN|nr:hypothetical protein MKW98_008029 [Papaver atlanticum]
MAFHGHHHVFSKPHTILTINSLTPAFRLNTQPANISPNTWRSSHVRSRRSANYHPNIWDYEFVESLNTDYKSEICTKRAGKLKENVKGMFVEAIGLPYSLKLIDYIQRLGLDYHFHNEIKSALDKICMDAKDYHGSKNYHLTFEALKFRLFRQHGYEISEDIFKSFIENSNAKKGKVKDVEGLLSLYEASFYAYEGEKILNEAQKVTSKHLQNYLKERNDDESSMLIFLEEEISHSFELPLLGRLPRMEVRRYINMYEMNQDMHPSLLEFAKLDFNMVQATYHEELKYASRWWRDLGLHESLGFARHRLVECFLWRHVTEIVYLITVIDDVYDVYGSLDELKQFKEAIESKITILWYTLFLQVGYKHGGKPSALYEICFFALYNTVNEVGYNVLRRNNLDVVSYLKKSWGDICKSYLIEATWYYSGYIPTLEQYTNNAWTSIAGPLMSIHTYCELGDYENITKEALESITTNPISASWRKINTSLSSSRGVFPSSFINIIQNIARTAQYIYQYGDGFGIPNHEAKDRIMSIIVKPIPI